MTLTVPNFPLLSSIADLADREKDSYDEEANRLLATLGISFRLRDCGSDLLLKQLLSSAHQLTAAIDEFQRNVPGRFPLYVLVLKAIAFQHRMLCLLPISTTDVEHGELRLEDHIFEIIRLTTFIYSDFVIFPTAEVRHGRPRLASLLKETLLLCLGPHCNQLSESSPFDDLILWSLVLGGVASFGSATRGWYVRQAFEHISARNLTREDLREILQTFLYWDHVLATPVTNLWVETLQLGWMQGQLSLPTSF